MNLIKKIKTPLLFTIITLSVMFGTTQKSQACYYDNYYTNYQNNLSAYNSTGNACYYYTAVAFYYYYISGYYGDYYAYRYDPYGNYSDKHIDSRYYSSYTFHDIYYNYYAYYGDIYWRVCHNVATR
jgi:hypothetical protein